MRKGPNTEPCRTPVDSELGKDICPSHDSLEHTEIYYLNHDNTLPKTPIV